MAILIIRPFIATIIVAAIITYIFFPLYKKLLTKVKIPALSAALIIILILFTLTVPVAVVAGKITQETYTAYLRVKQLFISDYDFKTVCDNTSGIACSTINFLISFNDKHKLNLGKKISQSFSALATNIITTASNFVFDIPRMFLHLFIALFVTYYMFLDGEKMLASLKSALPLKPKHKDHIFQQFNDVIHATIYGAIVIAIVQGVLATIGFFYFWN